MESSTNCRLPAATKVFIDGVDRTGWSTDIDARLLHLRLSRLGASLTRVSPFAKVIHNICWNNFLNPITSFVARLNGTSVILTASNFIDLDNPEFSLREKFEIRNRVANIWAAPGQKQLAVFRTHRIPSFYYPFEIEQVYQRTADFHNQEERTHICKMLGIAPNLLKGRIALGSFQRDSLGNDLSKPKWQKGADRIVDLLDDLRRESFVLILAGPRRHYLRKECGKRNIPYIFVGKETDSDDLFENNLSSERIALLYRLVDIYLVTSRSEGGPKAVPEAAASRTFILSTDVGIAPDFLDARVIYRDMATYKLALEDLVTNFSALHGYRQNIVEGNWKRFSQLHSDTNLNRLLIEGYSRVNVF